MPDAPVSKITFSERMKSQMSSSVVGPEENMGLDKMKSIQASAANNFFGFKRQSEASVVDALMDQNGAPDVAKESSLVDAAMCSEGTSHIDLEQDSQLAQVPVK